jgi:dsRNA-specific ribonuclease
MIHVGAFDGSPTGRKRQTKVAADAFEVVIAAYHIERGFEAVRVWVADMLKPLIDVAAKASVDLYNISRIQTKVETLISL